LSPEEAERLLAACRLLGGHAEEVRLLRSEVSDIKLYRSGTSQTFEITFADGSRAAFKPIEGVEATAAAWGHTATSVILNDYAAWLVARGLGYDSLIGATVMATSSAPGVGIGSMQVWFDGQPSAPGWEQATQLREAALLDAPDRTTGSEWGELRLRRRRRSDRVVRPELHVSASGTQLRGLRNPCPSTHCRRPAAGCSAPRRARSVRRIGREVGSSGRAGTRPIRTG
jgi:hypothetical protein